jgi:hypothetical protein
VQYSARRGRHRAAWHAARPAHLRRVDRGRPAAERNRMQHLDGAGIPHPLDRVLRRQRQDMDAPAGVRRGDLATTHRPHLSTSRWTIRATPTSASP